MGGDNSMRSTQTTFSHKKLVIKSEKMRFKQHLDEVTKYSEHKDTDFSQITRPMTSYGIHSSGGSTGSAGFFDGDLTRPNSSWKRAIVIQPGKLIKSTQNDRKLSAFWFERAEKIVKEVSNTNQILDNIDYM